MAYSPLYNVIVNVLSACLKRKGCRCQIAMSLNKVLMICSAVRMRNCDRSRTDFDRAKIKLT